MQLRNTVSPAHARQVLARVHGLDPAQLRNGKHGAMGVFTRHQCVQVDPIDVAGRNADLTLQSRVNGYRQTHLIELLYRERRLFEYYCKMLSIMPIETYPIFKRQMNAYAEERSVRSFFRKYKAETRRVLRALEDGPVSSRDIAGTGRVKTGWGHNATVSNMILARLWVSGQAAVSNREGSVRIYSLPEHIFPAKLLEAEPPEDGEDLVEMTKIIVRAERLVTVEGSPEIWYFVGKVKEVKRIMERLLREGDIFEVHLSNSEQKFYAPSEDLEEWTQPREAQRDYVRFLAPLDPLTWSRRVFATVYGNEYSWEVYKKPKDRKYGYYTLPIMFNGEYVGLIEPYLRKQEGALEIRSFHIIEGKINRERFLRALHTEVGRFCEYVGASRTEVARSPLWVRDALYTAG